jgi:hypothetical protein
MLTMPQWCRPTDCVNRHAASLDASILYRHLGNYSGGLESVYISLSLTITTDTFYLYNPLLLSMHVYSRVRILQIIFVHLRFSTTTSLPRSPSLQVQILIKLEPQSGENVGDVNRCAARASTRSPSQTPALQIILQCRMEGRRQRDTNRTLQRLLQPPRMRAVRVL